MMLCAWGMLLGRPTWSIIQSINQSIYHQSINDALCWGHVAWTSNLINYTINQSINLSRNQPINDALCLDGQPDQLNKQTINQSIKKSINQWCFVLGHVAWTSNLINYIINQSINQSMMLCAWGMLLGRPTWSIIQSINQWCFVLGRPTWSIKQTNNQSIYPEINQSMMLCAGGMLLGRPTWSITQ